ncbi:MAG: GGDEF domain-containing protein [Roseburia sp.]|nr:GGDEF domain-containing protein [Roseburia sp.]
MSKEEFDSTTIHKSALAVNFAFLAVHTCFLLCFSLLHITVMTVVNVFSISTYIFTFLLLHKQKILQFAYITYIEVLIHMSLATICLGWSCGFQICFLGMIILVFYAEYILMSSKNSTFYGAKLAMGYFLAFVICAIITHVFPPVYLISETMQFILMLAISSATFLLCIFFMSLLVYLTMRSTRSLSHTAQTDALTGLPNRHYLTNNLKNIYINPEMKDYWITIADIDNFKSINDTYGHNCGDYVLKTISALLQEHCQKAGITPCRWGGEEFVLFGSPGNGNNRQAQLTFLEDIRKDIENYHFQYGEHKFRLTITLGTAICNIEQSLDEWVNLADKKLYVGKYSGKNKVVF